ncbi:hypothetical protein C8J56DRAFT_968062 [Mycena floridula]|nr:hypothetical protein C8J56DRAFT_968062 [Mycena floridula]
MAKTPKHTVSFASDNDDDDDEIQNSQDSQGSSDGLDLHKILEEIQKQHTKKAQANITAFDNDRKRLYSEARKRAKAISQAGMEYIEQTMASYTDLRQQETTYEEYLAEVFEGPMRKDYNEYEQDLLLNVLPSGPDDLFHRRAAIKDEYDDIRRHAPEKRSQFLRSFLVSARKQLERSNQEVVVRTDAANLIKHYNMLLR